MQLLRPETPLFGLGLVVSAVIVGLVAVILWSTFIEGLPGAGGHFSLGNYAEVLLYPLTSQGGVNTLLVGAGTLLVNIFFGVPMAWLLHRTNTPFKPVFLTLMFLHILIPAFLKAMGWIILLSPKIGLINQGIRVFIPVESGPLSIYNLPSIAILQGLSLTPVVFFMVSGAFLAVDPAFEEAAEVGGASRFHSLRRVTLPLVAPAIVAAVIYTFMTAVSMFEIAALLGASFNIHVFSTLMYSALHPEVGFPKYGVAGVYGVILLVPTLVALFFYQRMLRLSHHYASVTGKGYKPKLVNLGPWKWAGAGFVGFYFFLDILLPFLSMAWVSFVPRIQMPSMGALAMVSLDGYRTAIDILIRGGVLANTATLILSVGVGITIISITISWIVLRTRMPGRFIIDTVSVLPHAVPRIAFAFAVSFVALLFVKHVPLYGSLAAIILCHTMAWIGFGTRTVNGALIQIHNDLEEAVLTCGGSRLVAIKRVFIPLLAPTIAYVAVWTMLLSYREVTMALFLQSPRNLVLSTAIWEQWGAMDTASAAALGMCMIGTMGVIIVSLLGAFPGVFLGRRV
jgi:iron(III) transport system permease protein